jgi:hypothetical protein
VTFTVAAVVTVTMADAAVLPPAPEQVTPYVDVAVGDTVAMAPLSGTVIPTRASVPVQDVALLDVMAITEDCPDVMLAGVAETDTVGGGVPPPLVVALQPVRVKAIMSAVALMMTT